VPLRDVHYDHELGTDYFFSSGTQYYIERHLDLKGALIRYSETDANGFGIEQGRLTLLVIRCTDESTAAADYTTRPTLQYNCRLNFIG